MNFERRVFPPSLKCVLSMEFPSKVRTSIQVLNCPVILCLNLPHSLCRVQTWHFSATKDGIGEQNNAFVKDLVLFHRSAQFMSSTSIGTTQQHLSKHPCFYGCLGILRISEDVESVRIPTSICKRRWRIIWERETVQICDRALKLHCLHLTYPHILLSYYVCVQ